MALPMERGTNARGNPLRVLNVVLGAWLFISAFAWPHAQAQMINTWILGILTVVVALVATAVPSARYVNAMLAVWLFISAWALPSGRGTTWNNVLVAIAIFVVSLARPGTSTGRPTFVPPRPA
jgi:hypothetical protein